MKKVKLQSRAGVKSLLEQLSKQLPLAVYVAIVILSIIISVPFTDKYVDWLDFDINTKKDQYTSKTYVLEVTLPGGSEKDNENSIAELQSILNKRLDNYGVEIIRIFGHEVEADDNEETIVEPEDDGDDIAVGEESDLAESKEKAYKYVKIVVETSKDIRQVDRLVRQPHLLEIMTPKQDVAFDDPENPLAPYLSENYDPTGLTRNSFRNIIVKELPTSTGDTAYFSIYKVKMTSRKKFLDVLDQYAGQTIGISTDDFVTPYNVPAQFDREAQTSGSYGAEFAPVVGQDPEDAQIAQILFDSGGIDLDYQIYEESENDQFEIVQPEYPVVVYVVVSAVAALVVFLYFNNREAVHRSLLFLLSVLVTNAFWLVILKYFSIEIDLVLGLLSGTYAFAYICTLVFTKDKFNHIKGAYLIGLMILSVLSDGFVRLMFIQLFAISIIATLVRISLIWFLHNIKKELKK